MAMDAWQKGEARTKRYQNIRIALDRMSEEIRGAITLNPDYNPKKAIYFVGENDGTNDTLHFISIAHPPDGYDYGSTYPPPDDNLKLKFDCCELGFYLSDNKLMRRKQVSNVPDDDTNEDNEEIKSGGSPDELASHITGLNFRYHDKDDTADTWKDAWNAKTAGELPDAVEITLTAKASSPRFTQESEIKTIVYLANQ
jgi:hypothetical protein